MRHLFTLGLLWLGTSAVACGGSNSSGSGFSHGNDGGTFGGGGDGSPPPLLQGDGAGGTGPNSGCSAAATLVYVIDEQGGLHSFDPGSLTFQTIGTINCPGEAASINSMAIDRNATAWVNDIGGNLFKVSTADASCQTTNFIAPSGFTQMGMGFSADAVGSTSETLYVDGIGNEGSEGAGLATIDLTSMALTPIAQFDGALAGQDCELTGTGNAQLFGFFTTTPAAVAQIDKSTAHILTDVPQPGVDTGTDWAFSFWGGNFYLYTADTTLNPGDTSDVTEYNPTAGTTKVVLQQIGFRIVGAGVSTCAPTQPPM
jgi:hypothetical protein